MVTCSSIVGIGSVTGSGEVVIAIDASCWVAAAAAFPLGLHHVELSRPVFSTGATAIATV